MSIFKMPKCPVCESTSFSHFQTCKDYFVSNEEFNIKECNSCGFKITEGIADEENIGPYYASENYVSHSNTSKGLVNSVYHAVRKFMLKQKRKLVEKATNLKTGNLLDLGTGTAFFLSEMQQAGWQVNGIEKSADARSFAKREFGLDVDDTPQLFRYEANSFDAITLWHVLEHIHQIDENMKAITHALKATGKLVIALPNHTSFDAKHYKEYWAAWDVPRHIWHFSPEQVELVGKKYQLKLSHIKSMPFDSFYVSMLSEKYKKSSLAVVKGFFIGTISWMKSIFNPARCSSVIYVFEKM
ncbi:class I SAM-dependent methyltransferase [Maribellus mangrovi]|uniref:class I SAM-dependent methyltransferase n=1 Tax=Maribellus mangrovi TaxID=3133146 RepID=UPI0030ECFD87